MDEARDVVKEIVAVRTGLLFRDSESRRIEQAVAARMQGLRLSSARQYCERLGADDAEWKELIPLLTTGETYFLRDHGQCGVLEQVVLPALIERNRGRRSLRLWSAGCSSGEEAYSLAILVHHALPLRGAWDVRIVGTDINEEALERARRARYGPWSFRMVGPDLRNRYFSPCGGEWQLKDEIRSMVTFAPGNLVTDPFPNHGSPLHDFDLIVCRNVFIYFRPDAISEVLAKLTHALVPGGYLVTGHAELHGQDLGGLRRRVLSGAVVYQRAVEAGTTRTEERSPVAPACGPAIPSGSPASGGAADPAAASARSASRPLHRRSDGTSAPSTPGGTVTPSGRPDSPAGPAARSGTAPDDKAVRAEHLLNEAAALLEATDYRGVIALVRRAEELQPGGSRGPLLAAKAHANVGELEQAHACCRQVLDRDPLCAEAYYLLAQLAGERGDKDEIKGYLRKVVYLDPSFVAAFLELADLYEADGETDRARSSRQGALDLLRKLPPESPVPPYSGLTAGELQLCVQGFLRGGAGAGAR